MIRKNFKLNVLLRLAFICLLISVTCWYGFVEVNWLRATYLLLFCILAVAELFYFIDRINRDLSTFFTALLQNDFTTSFNEISRGKSYNKLYSTLNKITKKFEAISAEKEQQLLFLEMLVEHVKAGIISFDSDEKVVMMNQAMQRILSKPRIPSLHSLTNLDPELLTTLREIRSGQNRLLKIKIKENLLHLSIHASEFHIGKAYYKLLSIQDIKTELEANEVETWQKLIRVLTHEIMNSVAPITSLTDTMLMVLKKNENDALSEKERGNLLSGLEAIKTRSNGLQNFTDTYRRLTRIPKPEFKKINLNELLEKTVLLHQPYFDSKNIRLTLSIPEKINIYADPDLLAQVVVNLLKNSQEALEGIPDAQIKITAIQNSITEIRIADNGPGITPEVAEQIFVPFFTTKPQGSGIGLALSRQIMHLHKGSLTVESIPGKGASFLLKF